MDHFCTTCQEYLPEAEFHKNKHKKSGLQDHCKRHQIKYAESYYLTNSRMIIDKATLKYRLKKGKITKQEYEVRLLELGSKR